MAGHSRAEVLGIDDGGRPLEALTLDHYCYANTNVPVNRYDVRELPLVEALEDKLAEVRMDAAIAAASKPRHLREALHIAHRQIFKQLYKFAGKERTADIAGPIEYDPAAFCGRSSQIVWEQSRKLAGDDKLREALIFLALGVEKAQPFRRGTGAAMAAAFAVLAGRKDAPNHRALSMAACVAISERDTKTIEKLVDDYIAG